jgi:hypothetical protein
MDVGRVDQLDESTTEIPQAERAAYEALMQVETKNASARLAS